MTAGIWVESAHFARHGASFSFSVRKKCSLECIQALKWLSISMPSDAGAFVQMATINQKNSKLHDHSVASILVFYRLRT
jgi:hypothetical protein